MHACISKEAAVPCTQDNTAPARPPAPNTHRFLAGSSDSDSDDEKRVVKSAKDKSLMDLSACGEDIRVGWGRRGRLHALRAPPAVAALVHARMHASIMACTHIPSPCMGVRMHLLAPTHDRV